MILVNFANFIAFSPFTDYINKKVFYWIFNCLFYRAYLLGLIFAIPELTVHKLHYRFTAWLLKEIL
jgi:hypothetical protein